MVACYQRTATLSSCHQISCEQQKLSAESWQQTFLHSQPAALMKPLSDNDFLPEHVGVLSRQWCGRAGRAYGVIHMVQDFQSEVHV